MEVLVATANGQLAGIIRKNEADLLKQWIAVQLANGSARPDLIKDDELRSDSRRFLDGLAQATSSDAGADLRHHGFDDLRSVLGDLSRSRAKLGFTPGETAGFVFSIKEPLFNRLSQELADSQAVLKETQAANGLIDKLGLYTFEVFQHAREELIARQQQELLELSTPVVQLWNGILALPLIGTLDSSRTQVVMENLLQEIVRTGSGIAIIDITGVSTVDTLVAQHLMKTVAAARLMGADCIISGIRAQIAQTIVHLGIDLQNVITKASMADALAIALKRRGFAVTPVRTKPAEG
jgi:rsbT co-antagonist protein RsbR